jgi:cell division protein FtsW
VGVLPITGVPLPLVSFGGSSMLVLLAATGMLLNVARHEVWSVRAPVIATTTKAAAERRGRRTAGRAPSRPARGGPGDRRGGPPVNRGGPGDRRGGPPVDREPRHG